MHVSVSPPGFLVAPQWALAYRDAGQQLVAFVNLRAAEHPETNRWLGNNSMKLLEDNHRNHHAFLSTVMVFSQYRLLAETIPWVYRAYRNQGLVPDYFPWILDVWKQALSRIMAPEGALAIAPVYDWMMEHHEKFLEISSAMSPAASSAKGPWNSLEARFLETVLSGDSRGAMEMVAPLVKVPGDLEDLYMELFQPVMIQVGNLWEAGHITVAQEHLASAVIGRLMAGFSTFRFQTERLGGRAVISAAPSELHEIGAWMVSDLLELAGWQVRYLGANTPEKDLLQLVSTFRPHLLALSVTMPYHIDRAVSVVRKLRNDPVLPGLHIMVGGRGTSHMQDMLLAEGVNATAPDAREAVRIARPWMPD